MNPAPNAESDRGLVERIAAGRIKHGVGTSEDFPGNACHLVSPIVGMLRLRERDGDSLHAGEMEWIIDRLSLVLDMAQDEAERETTRHTAPGKSLRDVAREHGINPVGTDLDIETGKRVTPPVRGTT